MSWTTCRKSPDESVASFFEAEFTGLDLLEIMVVNAKECYIAYRRPGSGGRIEAMAIELAYYGDDKRHNFGYNDFDECVNPWMHNCPEKILKMLSPLPDDSFYDYARKWRDECWRRVNAKKAAKKLQSGDTIRFKEPIKFTNGQTLSEFRFKKEGRRVYFQNGFQNYGITHWKTREFEIESHS